MNFAGKLVNRQVSICQVTYIFHFNSIACFENLMVQSRHLLLDLILTEQTKFSGITKFTGYAPSVYWTFLDHLFLLIDIWCANGV